MKFELVEPPEGIDDGAAELPRGHRPTPGGPVTGSGVPAADEEQSEVPSSSVRARMGGAVEGVRTSLELLRAHVAARSMAEDRSAVTDVPASDPGTAFVAHRFSAAPRGDGR